MHKFAKDFHTLNYAIRGSQKILLFAHSSPDGDTTGSVIALKEYIQALGGHADICCFDQFPQFFSPLFQEEFLHPDQIEIGKYKLLIAADSVERGFEKMLPSLGPDQITALIDHHPDINIRGDINIIDPSYSSVCQIIYDLFRFSEVKIGRKAATALMLGILSDTGMLQHSNTTPEVLDAVSSLMKEGAQISKIVETSFSNKKISTLKLWGRAFDKAKISPRNGMIVSALTKKDLEECEATAEDIAQVASILNTVPGTKFALILSERDNGFVKGSLRSEKYKDTDVSKIAAQFGGGGHKLASGFEIKGKIVETEDGWRIE